MKRKVERLWSVRSRDKNGHPLVLRMVDEEDLGDILLEMLKDSTVFDIGIRGVFVG